LENKRLSKERLEGMRQHAEGSISLDHVCFTGAHMMEAISEIDALKEDYIKILISMGNMVGISNYEVIKKERDQLKADLEKDTSWREQILLERDHLSKLKEELEDDVEALTEKVEIYERQGSRDRLEYAAKLEKYNQVLKDEVEIARERLGSAGYNILTEVKQLREENEKLKEDYKWQTNNSNNCRADASRVGEENEKLKERIEKLERIKSSAKQLINQWWEFGPESGFGETIDGMDRIIREEDELAGGG
jgi:hypothetical protein